MTKTPSIDNPIQDSVLRYVQESFLLIDPVANRIIDANASASTMLGYDYDVLCKLTVTALFPYEFPALITFTDSVLVQSNGWTNELSCKHQEGHAVKVEVSASIYEALEQTLIIMQLRDKEKLRSLQEHAEANDYVRRGITEWKRIERIFQDIEHENQLILRAVGEGIYGVNADGQTTFMNPAAERMLGWDADELVGKNIHSMIHYGHSDGSDYPSHECPIYAAFHDGEVHRVDDEVFWRKNGSAFPVEYTSTPIRDHGQLVGAVVVFRDISERKQAEQKLHAAYHEVEELKHRLELENAYLLEEIRAEHNYKEIVGNSMAVQRLVHQIKLVAPTNANVLITGESGTGKELIARAIHESSERHARPLIRVNCAAIPHDLFESEFFGHIKGAFTGAVSDRVGRFELADGGTLFLDEVGEIPLDLQSKLLRVLQENQFERVGDNKTRMVDVRVIAATNRDLLSEIEHKQFRQDLYFRLNVFPIESAALRERMEDVPILASYLLQRSLQKLNKTDIRLSKADIERLTQYDWPGNIRELENVLERAVILANHDKLVFELPTTGSVSEPITKNQLQSEQSVVRTYHDLANDERNNIIAALKYTEGKIFGAGGAAEVLEIRPTTLASKIKRLRIDPAEFRNVSYN